MKTKCIIVDDEPNAVKLLEVMIRQVTSWEILATCYDGVEALGAIRNLRPNLIFLDVNMPSLSGLEVAGLLPPDCRIIFTTAYSQYAAESYTFNTIDYLLKPVTLKRFLHAVEKVEQQRDAGSTVTSPARDNEYYFLKTGKTLKRINLNDVLYFEGEKEYVNVVTASEKFLIYKRLKDIEVQLRYPFIRIHNSFIINIRKMEKLVDNHVHIQGARIPVSDKFKQAFNDIIDKNLF